MEFIFDKSQLQDMHQIISLYKEFDRYKEYTREDLYYHILPSIKLNQYKIIKENNNVVAFANWAYLDSNSEKEYIKTKDFSNGEGKIFGIDVLINKKFKNYRTWINYSYTKNQFKFLDLENTFFPSSHDITNYFSWSHAFKYKNYEFSLGWMHRTGNPYTEAPELKTNTNNGNLVIVLDTNNMNSKRLPKYHRLDTSITYSFNFSENWKGKFGISILNIYNQKNIISRTYTAMPTLNSDNTISYELAKADKLSLGITPNFVFRVYF